MKKTPLYEDHKKLGAKLVPFAGWEMPVLYSGVIAEHEAVRNRAGLFDVSHMGEILVEGEEAELALDELTCNSVAKLYDGKAMYSAIINEKGGVVDDIIIYRISKDKFFVCVNASNAENDFAWFQSRNKRKAKFTDHSNEYALIAIQGPKAAIIMSKIAGAEKAASLKPFHFCDISIDGIKVMAARTGYTGEDGFELFFAAGSASLIWNTLLEYGQSEGLIPCGLGARDSLRLEACYPLHGHELSPDISAVESGLSWIVKLDKPGYPGKDILAAEMQNGPKRILSGFFVEENGIARENCKVFSEDGKKEIGFVTSGTKTPTINRALGLAIIESEYSTPGTTVKIGVRDKMLNSTIVKKPFYKRGA
jgi:aminomethyltransferase